MSRESRVNLPAVELRVIVRCDECSKLMEVWDSYDADQHLLILFAKRCEECTNQLVWNLTDVDAN